MFTLDEVNEVLELAHKLSPIQNKLEDYCDKIAKYLDFDNASEVSLVETIVSFKAEWFGPYHATNTEWYSFPIEKLSLTPDEVGRWIIVERRPWL